MTNNELFLPICTDPSNLRFSVPTEQELEAALPELQRMYSEEYESEMRGVRPMSPETLSMRIY